MKIETLWMTRRHRIAFAILLFFALAFGQPARTVQAAPTLQDSAALIRLGEFTRASLGTGERAIYTFVAPIDAVYTFVYVGDDPPTNFLLSVEDVDGNLLYDDVMDETPLTLDEGVFSVQVEAIEQGELVFVVMVGVGSMTDSESDPGSLINGSVYAETEVDGERYAVLTIEESPYYQMVAVYVEGDEGDVYEMEAMSEDFDYYSSTSDAQEPLNFTTKGGEFDLVVNPTSGGSRLQVSIFLSGPAPFLAFDEPQEGSLDNAQDSDTYQFTVAEAGTLISLAVGSDGGYGVEIGVGRTPDADSWYDSGYEGAGELQFVAPVEGTYYIKFNTDNDGGDTYTITATELGRAEALPVDELVRGEAPPDGSKTYVIELDEGRQFLVVVLAGADEDADLDLKIEQYDADGNLMAYDSSYNSGTKEIAAIYAEDPGIYFVTVSDFLSEDSAFRILATLGRLDELLDVGTIVDVPAEDVPAEDVPAEDVPAEDVPAEDVPAEDEIPSGTLEQWASDVEATSEYSEGEWSAAQASGEPDTPDAGDFATAWAADAADAGIEQLILGYPQAVVPTGIEIYETYNPGAVVAVEAYDIDGDAWVVLWEGTADTTGQEIAVFSPPLLSPDFATTVIRISVDETAVEGWNEIDAVKLIGMVQE